MVHASGHAARQPTCWKAEVHILHAGRWRGLTKELAHSWTLHSAKAVVFTRSRGCVILTTRAKYLVMDLTLLIIWLMPLLLGQ